MVLGPGLQERNDLGVLVIVGEVHLSFGLGFRLRIVDEREEADSVAFSGHRIHRRRLFFLGRPERAQADDQDKSRKPEHPVSFHFASSDHEARA